MQGADALGPAFEVCVMIRSASLLCHVTDEHPSYSGLSADYNHEIICHSAGEYVRDGVTTNGIESVWAVMRRGLHGVYHHASPKHLHRYVNEFTFRLNDGDVKRHTMQRLDSLTVAGFGPRLTYKGLIQ